MKLSRVRSKFKRGHRASHPGCAPAVIPVTRRFLARWLRRERNERGGE